MAQNLPIITKKLYNMVKLAFFMLRKGISKKKILLNLNLMMGRRKIAFAAGKVSTFRGGSVTRPSNLQHDAPTDFSREYEFSCKSTPLYRQYFNNKKKNYQNHKNYYYFEDTDNLDAINKVMENILSNKNGGVRQLRITDSPFPLQNEQDCDQQVDQAAEEFIMRFYSQLKEQDC